MARKAKPLLMIFGNCSAYLELYYQSLTPEDAVNTSV